MGNWPVHAIRRRRSEGIGTLILRARRDRGVMGQLHAHTYRIEGLLGSRAGLENLKMLKVPCHCMGSKKSHLPSPFPVTLPTTLQ